MFRLPFEKDKTSDKLTKVGLFGKFYFFNNSEQFLSDTGINCLKKIWNTKFVISSESQKLIWKKSDRKSRYNYQTQRCFFGGIFLRKRRMAYEIKGGERGVLM